jgi:hypothetical protein
MGVLGGGGIGVGVEPGDAKETAAGRGVLGRGVLGFGRAPTLRVGVISYISIYALLPRASIIHACFHFAPPPAATERFLYTGYSKKYTQYN